MANITKIKAKDTSKADDTKKAAKDTANSQKAAKTAKNSPKTANTAKKDTEKAVKTVKNDKKLAKAEKKATKKAAKANKKPKKIFAPFRYIKNSWHEVRQVRWPNRKSTWKMVLAVLAYTAAFIIFITIVDAILTAIFNLILKK